MNRLVGPIEAQMELVKGCNLMCFHCYNYWKHVDNLPKESKTGTKEYLILLNKLNDIGVSSVTFTGGEPFLNPELIFKMVKNAKKFGMEVGINTNATFINLSQAEVLADIGVDHILCSLLGSKDIHDNITGVEGSFYKTIEGIRLLVSVGISVAVNMVVSKKNLNDILFVGKLSKELQAKTFCATPITPPNSELLRYALTPEEYKTTLKSLLEIKRETGINVDTLEPITRCMFDEKDEDEFIEFFGGRICSAATTSCVISSSGGVRPCIHSDIEFGNLFKEKIETIWEKMGFWASKDILPNDCRACRAVTLCEGGCRMAAKVTTGSYCGKDMYMTGPINDKIRVKKYRPSVRKILLFNDKTVFRKNQHVRFREESFGGIVYIGSNIEFCTKEGFVFLKHLLTNESFSLQEVMKMANCGKINQESMVGILSRLCQSDIIKLD